MPDPNPEHFQSGPGPFPAFNANMNFPFYGGNQSQEQAASYQVLSNSQFPDTPLLVTAGPYWEYSVLKRVSGRTGLSAQPVGGPATPPTPADVIRVHAPIGWMEVWWYSRRVGEAPLCPSQDSPACANFVLTDWWRTAIMPGHFADGTQCWEISGYYRYDMRVPYTEQDLWNVAAAPYSTEDVAQNQVGPATYSGDITGPDIAPAGAPTDVIGF